MSGSSNSCFSIRCKNKNELGHRGANHPVKNLINEVEITSQNHGFEVMKKQFKKNVKVTHQSLFDNSIEWNKIEK